MHLIMLLKFIVIFDTKNFAIRPIKITVPHVKRVTPGKPIIKSVMIKLNNKMGKNLFQENIVA